MEHNIEHKYVGMYLSGTNHSLICLCIFLVKNMLVFGTTEMKEGNMKKKKKERREARKDGKWRREKKTNNLTLWK